MDKKKGYGLGLAITKNLVQLMKGQLKIESEVDKGSKFTVKIPAKTSQKLIFNKEILNGKKVLFINFSDKLSQVSRSIFEDMSAKVFFSTSSVEAKHELETNHKSYDMILFYWNYREDDPFKLEDIYGSNNQLIDKSIFLVQSSIKFKKPPNGTFLFTPLKRSELKRHANQIIINQNRPIEKEAISHTKKEQKKVTGKVLLVDDSEDSRLLIKIFLKKTDIELDIAVDGIDGLNKYKQNHYDLILMDVQMPLMDGLKCTEEIRKYEANNPKKSKVQILAMTAYAFKEDIQKTKNAGCNGHISKPINKENLIQSVRKLMNS